MTAISNHLPNDTALSPTSTRSGSVSDGNTNISADADLQLNTMLEIMRQVELFRGLDDAQLARLATIAQRVTYDAGAMIFHQDDPGDKMYLVESGQVEIRVNDHVGRGHTALFLGTGQVFGEMALVDEGARSATVSAVDPNTTVYAIASDEFKRLCSADTAIGYILMRNIAQDMSFKLRHRQLDPSEDHS